MEYEIKTFSPVFQKGKFNGQDWPRGEVTDDLLICSVIRDWREESVEMIQEKQMECTQYQRGPDGWCKFSPGAYDERCLKIVRK